MRGLGREIHHGGESNLCPTRDGDGRVPPHKGTSLRALASGPFIVHRRGGGQLIILAVSGGATTEQNSSKYCVCVKRQRVVCKAACRANHFLKKGDSTDCTQAEACFLTARDFL